MGPVPPRMLECESKRLGSLPGARMLHAEDITRTDERVTFFPTLPDRPGLVTGIRRQVEHGGGRSAAMKTMTLEEAQGRLAEVVQGMGPGDEVVLTREGRPV